jgi:hypothetical protein
MAGSYLWGEAEFRIQNTEFRIGRTEIRGWKTEDRRPEVLEGRAG